MNDFRHITEKNLLLNIRYNDNKNLSPSEVLEQKILDGQFDSVINLVIKYVNQEDPLNLNVDENKTTLEEWFYASIALLLYFIQNNFVGPFEETPALEELHLLRQKALDNLSLNDQCNENIKFPELLYVSKKILATEILQNSFASSSWWLLRANYVHQLVLEQNSDVLYNETELLMKKVSGLPILNDQAIKALFHLESAQIYLLYKRIQKPEAFIQEAKNISKLNFELKGALGKRTKYQQDNKPQLYLEVKIQKEIFLSRKCDILPHAINLNDDLRLEEINFCEEIENPKLGIIEESVIMANFFHTKTSQPKDDISNQQLLAYLNFLIKNTHNWSLKMACLFEKSLLESNHKITIERSMSQIEYLLDQISDKKVPVSFRIDCFFASGMKPIWIIKQNLAKFMLNIGLVKGALDIFINLSLWEDVIVCYTILEMRHKATEIIEQELNKKPSVKLWCLLGDATEDVKHYEKAWNLSEHKSSRVQRHWGFHYYAKQNYTKAIPHLKLSVELNSIQENVWVRLGFAALQVEDWKLAALAYRNYCNLEQSSFEVWNNLAKAYINLGEKSRAHRCLKDAIKCNFENWHVWDNLMVVSIDLNNFTDVYQSYHRILDLKGAHIDIQVLSILSNAIINESLDCSGNSCRKYLNDILKLFGRLTALTSTNADVWKLYAEVSLLKNDPIYDQKAIQYLQKAYKAAVSSHRWFMSEIDTVKILEICIKLGEVAINNKNLTFTQRKELLNRTRLSIQSTIKEIKNQQWQSQENIFENLKKTEDLLKNINEELEKIKLSC